MNDLIIHKTDFTPAISFLAEKQTFEIEGVSRPENVSVFYAPIFDWITSYETELYENREKGGERTVLRFSFKFSYLNSSSAKMIFKLLECLVQIKKLGYAVIIDWYYEDGDDMLFEDGQELSEAIDLPFNYHIK